LLSFVWAWGFHVTLYLLGLYVFSPKKPAAAFHAILFTPHPSKLSRGIHRNPKPYYHNNTLEPSNDFTNSEKVHPQENLRAPIISSPMSKIREVGFIFIISMLQVFPMAEMSSVLPITQIIAHYFNIADEGLLPWKLAAYGLTFGTFILISGRLGDLFSHKDMVIIGFGWMACGV
jgi:hypothetical protein